MTGKTCQICFAMVSCEVKRLTGTAAATGEINMNKKQFVKLFVAIVCGALFGMMAPDWAVSGANRIRNAFGGFIRFLAPLIIIGFITSSIVKAGKSACRMLLLTFGISLASTVVVGFFAYSVSWCVLPYFVKTVGGVAAEVTTATGGSLCSVAPTIVALLVSVAAGLAIAIFKAHRAAGRIEKFKKMVAKIIGIAIEPLMPVYVFTVVADIVAGGKILQIGCDCVKIVAVSVLMTFAVMLMIYMVAGIVTRQNPIRALRNMMPAYVAGYGSCSSVAAIPYTLRQVQKNGVSDTTAEFVIPLCSNVHHVGGVANLIVYAAGVMILQGGTLSAHVFIPFVLLVALISFATPGIPGGVAMASASVAGSVLGFTSEQYAVIVAIYIALDGIGTACNLTCDGAVAMIVEKLVRTCGNGVSDAMQSRCQMFRSNI